MPDTNLMDIYYLCFVTVYYLLLSMIDNIMKAYLANRRTVQVQFVNSKMFKEFPSAMILVNLPKSADERRMTALK